MPLWPGRSEPRAPWQTRTPPEIRLYCATDCGTQQVRQMVTLNKMNPEIVYRLINARRALVRYMAQRSKCLSIQIGLPITQRTALSKVLVGDQLYAFRAHADSIACVTADVCGTGYFSQIKGVHSPVDMFFGSSLTQSCTGAQNHPSITPRALIDGLQCAARKFIKCVRALPHDSAKARLGACERQLNELLRNVVAEMDCANGISP